MRTLRFFLMGSVFLFVLTACGGGGGSSTSTTSLSAVADTTAQNLTVGTATASFSPLTASGGTPPYTYSYTGTLPAGLSYNASTGVVSGTPTAIYASADLVFTVHDDTNTVANTTSTVKFTVAAAPPGLTAVADTTAQNLTVGTAMPSFSPLTASGGTPPYTYSYTGTLPAGLSYNASTGVVSGTPTAIYASADLVFTVHDATNTVASTSSMVNFTVVAAPVSAGALDVSFNLTGQVFTDINTSLDGIQAIAIQSDGKIVAAGSADSNSSTGLDFALVRYNLDGSLDTSFGTGGKIVTDFGNGLDVAKTVVIQTDGKIIAAGYTNEALSGGPYGLAMARYNTDGSLDTSFGTNGRVITANAGDIANSIALQSDGKIIIGAAGAGVFSLARYNTDGTLDATFGTSGKVATTITIVSGTPIAGYDSIGAIAIQSNDKIVAAGAANLTNDFAVVRYNADGSLDTTFGSGGIVTTDIGSIDSASDVAIQSDGKIVAVGTTGNHTEFALVRYTATGSLDNTFGTNGIVTTSTSGRIDQANAVAIQSDGKIVAAGTGLVGGASGVFIAERFNTDGSLDTSFDTDGKVTTDLGDPNTVAYTVAIEPTGNAAAGHIVVAGTSNNDFALVRYLP